jgi:hypothetical protein
MNHWDTLLAILKSSGIHIIYSNTEKWAYLTDKHGDRYRLDENSTLQDAESIITSVRAINEYQMKYLKQRRHESNLYSGRS